MLTNHDSSQPGQYSGGTFVVGIGASAGGVESLEGLFRNLSRHDDCAYVVVQHLSVDFKSQLTQILQRWTDIPIQAIQDGTQVRGGNVYVAPAGKRLIVHEGRFLVSDKDPRGVSLPIDEFFRSLAQEVGRYAIAVIVSGTGSDGTLGAQKIADSQGLVIAQLPETASFKGMPESLIASGASDLELSPDAIPSAIDQFITTNLSTSDPADRNTGHHSGSLDSILQQLDEHFSIDFSQYKQTTIERRIQRRMGFKRLDDYDHYAALLRQDPTERKRLYDDLLIGVTAFFRDSTVFDLLGKEYLRELIQDLPSDRQFRAWIPGCASGEEAYSIAIVLHEIFDELGRTPNVKLFATDLNRRAIQTASAGIYSAAAMSGIDDVRTKRYFERTPGGFQAIHELRQMLVFAVHNVVTDTPFLRLDMVCCRNLLIYLQPFVQKRLISLFHFSMRKNALLVLGTSETPGELGSEFEVIDTNWRVYKKRQQSSTARALAISETLRSPLTIPGSGQQTPSEPTAPIETKGPLLDQFMPTGILINGKQEVVHCYGGAESYLRIPAGRVSRQITGLVLESLRPAISRALQRLANTDASTTAGGTLGPIQDGPIESGPIESGPIDAGLCDVVVTAESVTAAPDWVFLRIQPAIHPTGTASATHADLAAGSPAGAETSAADRSPDRLHIVEEELQITRQNLQSTIEELEAANQELQSTNEELTLSNEELQSTNEELHSVNEELFTVNTDHQRKIGELIEVTDDLNQLLIGTEVGVMFLDADLRIRRFTENMTTVFALVQEDIGRKITTFSGQFGDADFVGGLHQVQATRQSIEYEVTGKDDSRFLIRVLPYSTIATPDSELPQLIVTLVDITSIKRENAKRQRLRKLIDHSSDFIVSTDGNGIIETWNIGAEKMVGLKRSEATGRHIVDVLKDKISERPFEDFFAAELKAEHEEITNWTLRETDRQEALRVHWRASLQHDENDQVVAVSIIAHDVSEIASANRRVAASERELRQVMESVTEAIIVLDKQWRYTFVNDGMCEMMGINRDDLLGKQIWDVFPDAQGTAFDAQFHESMRTGKTIRFEEHYAGTNRWYQCYCFPHEDRLTVFFTDVTDLHLSNDLIRQQAEMLDLSHDAIIAWELGGGISFWNRGAELLYGFSRSEVMGKVIHDVLRTEHSVPRDEITAAMLEKGDWEGRVVHYTRQNQPLDIASRHQLIQLNAVGRQVVMEINRDMTEYDQLSSRVAQLASIADLTTDFVGTINADGQILYLNHGAARMLDYDSPKQLQGKHISELHSPETYRVLRDLALPTAASGQAYQFESELLTKAETPLPISQVVMAHTDGNDVVTHYSTIARDISGRKTYELELESMRDAAEAANRAKSAFLAQMSHEIRTPMTAILGCSEQLQESVRLEENKQLSRVMVEQGHALMAILDDILDLSRIEAEKIELEFRYINVAKVLRDLHRLMMPRAQDTGLAFELDLQGEFPVRFHTDPVRLRQIIVNLLSNAFKFTPRGSVTLRACCRHETDESMIQIDVVDTGVGIADEGLQDVFDAFTRLQNPKANAAGTGLGLTIAQRLTNRLGGELEVESAVGKGTTFSIRLPVPHPRDAVYAVFSEQRAHATGNDSTVEAEQHEKLPIHILVAEDTPAIRFLLSRILSPVVQDLTMVENGQQAVDLVTDDQTVSMVLMDMQMPVMSGVDATREIRLAGYTLPIIALTAGAMDADRNQCLKAGCNEFLTKPINKRKLLSLIEELAETESDSH
ncbi:PAS domain S-box protein [Stieleria sp. TO1_6]|uniref:chemotaxis protein CheB n=1 Tax=Stieleria tagensis TaxID=2956795 RepID=UPI00209AB61F|nr:chemotaxis protein CheB [Stieleria tagensis]MCO8120115.1 PAS domain S-box protein [Stieleria tagensis]